MAFIAKQSRNIHRSSDGTAPSLAQTVRVSRATASLPATTTATIFTVRGGRVKLKALIGEVTTAIQAQACNLSVNCNPTVGGTAVIASTVDINADEVGTTYGVEGDGTALVATSSGFSPGCFGDPVVQEGVISITTSATNTGSVKWDLYYEPLDRTAYVVAA